MYHCINSTLYVPLIAILKYIFTINAQVYNKLHIVRKIVKTDVSSCSTGCSYTFMIYKTNVNTEAFLSDLLECKCTN